MGTKKLPEMHYTNCNITKGGNGGRIIVSGNVSVLYVCVHHIDIWYAHMYFALRLQQEFKIEFVHFFTYVIDCILCYFILCSSLIFTICNTVQSQNYCINTIRSKSDSWTYYTTVWFIQIELTLCLCDICSIGMFIFITLKSFWHLYV